MKNQQYEIHIEGHLNHDWAEWLEGMQMCCLENGEMILCGALADQAALMGVLNKLNRLNLTILSVIQRVAQMQDEQPAANPQTNRSNEKQEIE